MHHSVMLEDCFRTVVLAATVSHAHL